MKSEEEKIEISNYELNKKIRKKWKINPVEKIKKSKKKYNRKKAKRELRKRLDEE